MARTSRLICGAALAGLMLSSAASAQGFHCPPAGTTVTTSTGVDFKWTGSDPSNSALCLAQYGKAPPFWSFAIMPSWDQVSAATDLAGLQRFFPLHPGEAINISFPRTFQGAPQQFQVVGVVEQGAPMAIGPLTRQVLVINVRSPGNPGAGASALGNAVFLEGRFVVDQLTNALLAIDLEDPNNRIGPATIHWKAVSLKLP